MVRDARAFDSGMRLTIAFARDRDVVQWSFTLAKLIDEKGNGQ